MDADPIDFDAVILAGGRSARLGGVPKQGLTYDGDTLLREQDRAWRRLMSRPSVTTVTLAGVDHTFSSRAALELVREKSVAWLAQLASARKAAS